MSNKRVRVSYGRTFNLGNYESLKIEAEIEEDVEDKENPKIIMNSLYKKLKSYVEKRGDIKLGEKHE